MTKYTPEIEKDILKDWIDLNPFKISIDKNKIPYSILMPPPNITGVLHLGHVLNNTLQDILIRYHRKNGYNACWFAGIDHASIATEAKVCAWLKEKGIDKNSLTKEEFLEYCWKWKDEYGSIIIEQLKKCGFSFDYERINFTMDKTHYDLVIKTYNELKEKGFIYKAIKQLPFDKMANTFLSESETYEKNGKFFSERTNCLIEYRESEQIFLKMGELYKPAIDKIFNGIEMNPKNSFNSYKNWFTEVQDWCISRQLSWGQSIPDEEGMVFDTWFSSWLWAISCFKSEEEYKYFAPSNIIITGEDISFFWIAKMIICNDFINGDIPFNDIYFTGIMRDEKGRKFSKQLNNSPDILKLIEEHGADNVRFSTIVDHQAGLDCKWSLTKVIQGKKFCNKIWNIDKLIAIWKPNIETKITDTQIEKYSIFKEVKENKIKEYHELIKSHRFSEALLLVYNLIWEDFSSQLLENIKPDTENFPCLEKRLYENVKNDFNELLNLLEPFMPFISNYMINKNK
jgi:valyl-tRNA synthetase